ncbi:MAG TPA: site-2 protease family protein [Candidatus Angelobacter sp.]|nr:site-2 protease family protein [Candidatus Angelobacter sp.]
MRSHIKLGKIFGIEVGIHYSWFIIAVLIMFSLVAQFQTMNKDWSPNVVWGAALLTSLLFFLGLLAHELSHSLVAKARHLPVSRITLFALGGVSVIEKESPDAWTEFLVAVVGPITSVVLGAIMMGIAYAMGPKPEATPGSAILWYLGEINIALGVFNMLPGFPLDGGRVLRSILWGIMHNMERATRVAARVGQVVALLFILGGIWEFFAGRNIGGLWIAFIGWFLLQAAGANYLDVKMRHALEGVRAADLMSQDCPMIEGAMSVQDFVDHFLLRTARRCFLVKVMDRLAGLITPNEIRTLSRELWPMTPLQQIMKPLDKIRSVGPDTPVTEALDVMGKEDLNQVPVVSNGGLLGMLSRSDILQALRARIELKKAS